MIVFDRMFNITAVIQVGEFKPLIERDMRQIPECIISKVSRPWPKWVLKVY